MKKLRIIMCVCFFVLLMVPVATFRWEENISSKIDNRVLANNPFGDNYEGEETADLTYQIEGYIEDRIGLRDSMIYGYTMLHDKLFHQLVHPTYAYGKDEYVFFQAGENIQYNYLHAEFADMVGEIQRYCDAREVPFLFVFEPSKTAALSDKLSPGVNFNNNWVKEFEKALDEEHVNYIDNTEILKNKIAKGEMVFNKQYDAGHWNDLGAFYGVNHILETMKKTVPGVHVNTMDEFSIEEVVQTSLPVSEFPIEDPMPWFTALSPVTDNTQLYGSELEIDRINNFFGYAVNEQRKAEGSPKTMFMQGSYMNSMGGKFLQNGLGEYIAVHSYQNIMDFDYYFNIFKPEYVVFEATEYVFTEQFFSTEKMKYMELPPTLESFNDYPVEQKDIGDLSLSQEEGQQLLVLKVDDLHTKNQYAYLQVKDQTYEFQKKKDEKKSWFELTIDKDNFHEGSMSIKVVDKKEKYVVEYK